MILTVEPIESLESIQSIFDELYTSSEPYLNLDNNPWSMIPMPEGGDKKTIFTQHFFNPLNHEGVVIRVIIDGVTVSMFSGKVVEGIFSIFYSLYNDFNGSRAWLYDNTIMTEHLMSIREYFLTFGILGYKLDTVYNSSMYKYHKLNKPVLGLHSSITETTTEMEGIRTITYLF
jgi:hypothetical protein